MFRKALLGSAAAAIVAVSSTGAQAFIFYGNDMEEAREMKPVGSSFENQLAREYREFFLFEADDMRDWIDADYFAEKALAANAGKTVMPEDPAEWDIDEVHMSELQSARSGLVEVLDKGARESAPREAAIAQAKYDCWVEQQEEGHQFDHIAACRDAFLAAMTGLENAMAKTAEVPAPAVDAPQTETVVGEEIAKMVVYFGFDESGLTGDARATIYAFVAEMKPLKDVVVFVEGHADRAGPASYNVGLSEARAEMVRAELIRQGITIGDLEEMKVAAKGEADPRVATGDGVAEPANRRVEVVARGLIERSVSGGQTTSN
jgi:OmpA-OmpF porin, OOP family